MSGVIFETAMREFASKVCVESKNSNVQRYFDAQNINIRQTAFEIDGYSRVSS